MSGSETVPVVMHGPDPASAFPISRHRRVGFLKPLVDDPLIEIGDYTYYDDPDGPEHFVARCVRHHYPFIGDRLVIGRFCALASGMTFVMNGANHVMTGFSTYPFNIFGGGWEEGFDLGAVMAGVRGDTIVGNDVWIGEMATIMPGVRIGDGAIVAARSVVTADLSPYTIVGGNPARTIRQRFEDDAVRRLLAIAWWNWPVEKISRNRHLILGADLAALERAQ